MSKRSIAQVCFTILLSAVIMHSVSAEHPGDERPEGQMVAVISFIEGQLEGTTPATLSIYLVNQAKRPLRIYNEIDSIGVDRPGGARHYDFGTTGKGVFAVVAPGEGVKVTLLVKAEECADIERNRGAMSVPVKYAEVAPDSKITTVLAPARVVRIR